MSGVIDAVIQPVIGSVIGNVVGGDGPPTLRAIRGWSDGKDCDGSGTYVVQFSTDVYFTSHAGVKFVKTDSQGGNPETSGGTLTTAETSPSQELSYSGFTWGTAPAVGDIISFDYAQVAGNYQDEFSTPMADQNIEIENCLNVAPSLISQIPDQLNDQGDNVNFNASVYFDEGNGANPTYTATNLPPDLTIDSGTGVVTGAVTTVDAWNSTIKLTTSFGSVQDSFSWEVQAAQPATDCWKTEAGGTWGLESGAGCWETEASNQAVTHDGEVVTHDGEEVTYG